MCDAVRHCYLRGGIATKNRCRKRVKGVLVWTGKILKGVDDDTDSRIKVPAAELVFMTDHTSGEQQEQLHYQHHKNDILMTFYIQKLQRL